MSVMVPAHFLLYVDIELDTEHDATADRPALYLPNGCSTRAARAASYVHMTVQAHDSRGDLIRIALDSDLELDRAQ